MSENPSIKKTFIDAATLITVIPALLYYCADAFETGKCEFYHIPYSFIDLNLLSLISYFQIFVINILFGAILLVGSSIFVRPNKEDESIFILACAGASQWLLSGVVTYYLWLQPNFSSGFNIFHSIFSVIYSFVFFSSYFFYKYLQGRLNKFNLSLQFRYGKSANVQAISPMLTRKTVFEILLITFLVFGITDSSRPMGNLFALLNKNYALIGKNFDNIILKKYGDQYFTAKFYKKTNQFSDTIRIYKGSELDSTPVKNIHIENLQTLPAQHKAATK